MRHFTLTFLILFSLINGLYAQWESLGDDIIPESHRVWSLKLASDHSIWAISTLDAFPPAGEVPKIHRSADEGETWINSEIPFAINAYGWDISPIDSMNAFIALDTAGLYQTIDGGQSWNKVDSYTLNPLIVHFFNENDGWVFGGDSTNFLVQSVTNDGGLSWTYIGYGGWGQPEGTSIPPVDSTEFQPAFSFSMKSSYTYNGESIMFGTSKGKYWLSTDKGYNWVRRESPLTDMGLWLSNITMKDSSTFMIVGDVDDASFSSVQAVSFATKDGGQTWIEGRPGMTAAATQYIPDTDSIFIMTNHNNFGFGDKGTVISYDYGAHWERIDFGNRILAIDFIDKETGIGACCNHSFWNQGQIFKWNFELPTAAREVVNTSSIQLSPNPVSDRLFIEIGENISANKIKADVISVNGALIKSKQYPNSNQLEIDVSDLPKGFYVLKISSSGKLYSKKFIKI